MKAVVIKEFCRTLDQVCVSSIDRPRDEHGRILIQVKACGVNFVDTLYVRQKMILALWHTLTQDRRGASIRITRRLFCHHSLWV